MSIGTFFKHAGTDLEKFFGVVVTAAGAAEPILDLMFPGLSLLINGSIAEASKVLAMAEAAGAQGGSALQQAAAIEAAVAHQLIQYAQTQGLSAPTAAQITAWSNAVMALVNSLPTILGSKTPAPASPAPAVAAPAPTTSITVIAATSAVPQTGPGLAATVAA